MEKKELTRYVSKHQPLLSTLEKIKLWPSRSGVLHGIREIDRRGCLAVVTTHCGEKFTVRDSRNSRAARWLRSRRYSESCKACAIPGWKLSKYAATVFSDRR
ncbi:MAG: hypothetical protein LBI38_07190 [Oscillospiraceae bacterium]|jgi:pyrrolysyl-tRNA synthetase-like protein|nr:hypothetical protein [Oscillospiraceae bacterium]